MPKYHATQARENKLSYIVICNLHPTTSNTEIGVDIESMIYYVRQVSNVSDKSKRQLPIFFINLKPTQINHEIFKLSSFFHTKIKIEKPQKQRVIIQYSNWQEYDHSKGYYAHPPRCVRYAAFYPTSECPKPPAICALYGDLSANYSGYTLYKNSQWLNQNPNTNQKIIFNKINIVKHQELVTRDRVPSNMSNKKSYPQLPKNLNNYAYLNKTRQDHSSVNVSPDSIPNNQLSTFLMKFKQIINPLIQLLMTVLN